MPRLFLLCLVAGWAHTAAAQVPRNASFGRPFLVDIRFMDRERFDGILYDLTDTSIVIIPADVKRGKLLSQQDEIMHVPIDLIRKLRMERRGAGRLGIGLGMSAGVLAGGLIGVAVGDNVARSVDRGISRTESVLYGGFGGGLLGGVTGMIVALLTRDEGFVIDGNPARYVRVRPELTTRSLRHLTRQAGQTVPPPPPTTP